jgi:fumarylacetoacetate (FAA) hydrolase
MRLATLADNRPDGVLIVVSADGGRFLDASSVARNLQAALDDWARAEPALRALASRLETGQGEPLAGRPLAAPLPRAWQWLDGSAFESHGAFMARLFGREPKPPSKPLMYQGLSHQFLGPFDDVPLPRESDGIDFEGELGVITDVVPMGVTPAEAAAHIVLLVQINDWSLRALAGEEMATGFGWIQAKPACSMAPFAVTPDELGPAWKDGRAHLRLRVHRDGAWFGEPNAGAMSAGFPDLIAHAAATRRLCAGTIIGSGTVSNEDYAVSGSTCIAERRAIETLEHGAPQTEFLRFSERVRMEALDDQGRSVFGAIDQRVVEARPAP